MIENIRIESKFKVFAMREKHLKFGKVFRHADIKMTHCDSRHSKNAAVHTRPMTF